MADAIEESVKEVEQKSKNSKLVILADLLMIMMESFSDVLLWVMKSLKKSEFEPFFAEMKTTLADRKIGIFGSYE